MTGVVATRRHRVSRRSANRDIPFRSPFPCRKRRPHKRDRRWPQPTECGGDPRPTHEQSPGTSGPSALVSRTGTAESVDLQHLAVKRSDSVGSNRQNELALAECSSPRPPAAQQDILIGQELEAIRLANLNLEQQLAMDVQFLEATNDAINMCNDHIAGFESDHRPRPGR